MQNINYIKVYTNKIIINNNQTKYISLNKYLDSILLDQLTTYDGRICAVREKYGFVKLTPIYINKTNILIPLNNLKDFENIYINICNIIKLESKKHNTLIVFKDTEHIIVNKKINMINKYIKRAITINHYS